MSKVSEIGKQSYDRRMAVLLADMENGTKNYQDQYPVDKEVVKREPVESTEEQKAYAKKYAELVLRKGNDLVTFGSMVKKIRKQSKRVGSKKKEIKPMCDFQTAKKLIWEAYKAYAEQKGFEPVVTYQMKEVLPLLSNYFTGNQTDVLDSDKGIYLFGPCGSGKTVMMKVIQTMLASLNYTLRFNMKSVPNIYNEAIGEGKVDFSDYFYGRYCFDDLGFDDKVVKHYGNILNPMQVIFTERYNRFQSHGQITHVTSNLRWSGGDDNMSDRFDDRIRSRGSEMFNFIKLDCDEDMRKL